MMTRLLKISNLSHSKNMNLFLSLSLSQKDVTYSGRSQSSNIARSSYSKIHRFDDETFFSRGLFREAESYFLSVSIIVGLVI